MTMHPTFDLLTRLPFRPTTDLKGLPPITAIYFAVRRDGGVRYIGKTRNLAQRWSGQSHHRAEQLIAADTFLAWMDVGDTITDERLTRLERLLIRQYAPELNDMPMPRTPTQDARQSAGRQAQRLALVRDLVADCRAIESEIVSGEQQIERQIEATVRWLRLYQQGLEDVRAQRQQQARRLRDELVTIRQECERFLPSIRLAKK